LLTERKKNKGKLKLGGPVMLNSFQHPVLSKQLKTCHSEPFGFALDKLREESHQINSAKAGQTLRGVYPEPKTETLRFTQGDKKKGSG
jgi:hypothetical protein